MSLFAENIGEMRAWCQTVGTKAEEFKELVDNLYSRINDLTSGDFKGGVSEAFQENVLNLRPFFEQQYQTMMDFADLLNQTASINEATHEEAAAAAARLGVN